MNDLRWLMNVNLLQDYQRHISVLKESLAAKEEHYNMLQTDVSPTINRLPESESLDIYFYQSFPRNTTVDKVSR